MMGLKLEDGEEADDEEQFIECWPDNWLPFCLFAALETQWNVGPKSVIGQRYEAIPGVFEEYGIRKKQRAEMRQCLRVMEKAALQLFNANNE